MSTVFGILKYDLKHKIAYVVMDSNLMHQKSIHTQNANFVFQIRSSILISKRLLTPKFYNLQIYILAAEVRGQGSISFSLNSTILFVISTLIGKRVPIFKEVAPGYYKLHIETDSKKPDKIKIDY